MIPGIIALLLAAFLATHRQIAPWQWMAREWTGSHWFFGVFPPSVTWQWKFVRAEYPACTFWQFKRLYFAVMKPAQTGGAL